MSKINTGKYRICKNQIGIGGTIETLSEHKSKEDLKEAFERIEKKTKWNYYCEEEVIYKGTLLDENKKPIDSDPSWIRLV